MQALLFFLILCSGIFYAACEDSEQHPITSQPSAKKSTSGCIEPGSDEVSSALEDGSAVPQGWDGTSDWQSAQWELTDRQQN